MDRIKVCIISCGIIANKAHIPAYLNREDAFFVSAVSDVSEKAARGTSERFNIGNWYTNAEEMLIKERPDLVSVCVPNKFHKEYTLLALSHGANVLCEKPVAYTYGDALEMYSFAKEKGRLLVACQSMRYTPDRIAAHELIEEGVLGNIYYAELSRIRRRGIPSWGKFHIRSESGGGAFLDIGVHMIDSLLWLMGNPEIKSVSGTACAMIAHQEKQLKSSLSESGALGGVDLGRSYSEKEFDVEDFASGSAYFKNGARVNFKVAWAVNLPDETSMKIVGDSAGLSLPSLELYGSAGSFQSDFFPKVANDDKYKTKEFGGHFHLIDHLADVMLKGEPLMIRPEETINTAAFIDLFYRSAELKREVTIDEIKG